MLEEHGMLSDYCSWSDCKNVKRILLNNPSLDLTYREGIMFIFAIKKKNPKMLNILLEYYHKQNLQEDRETMNYKTALYRLRSVLEYAYDSVFEVTAEIKEILFRYIPNEDDDKLSQDLDCFDEPALANIDKTSDLEDLDSKDTLNTSL